MHRQIQTPTRAWNVVRHLADCYIPRTNRWPVTIKFTPRMPQSSVMILHNSFCEHFSSSGISGEFCLAGDEGKTAWIGAKPQLIPKCGTFRYAVGCCQRLDLAIFARPLQQLIRRAPRQYKPRPLLHATMDTHISYHEVVRGHFCSSAATTY
ncbi:hypothetical protein B0H14DRAFT_1314130 [Mycena olivaceomarginata]|nr:hypothetical protein B0H14DRAFT_1314130 [Mycena olivaceomarginata]